MGDSGESQKLEDSAVVELTGRIMVVAVIVLFVVVTFVIFLHLYAKWYWRRMRPDGTNTTRRRRLDFAGGHRELSAVTALRHGLDPSVLKSIPVIQFSPQDFKDGLECSVCLCEVSQGEKARLLPKCNHGFHVECIDMWFQSHSTCPLCRSPVSNSNSSTPDLSQEMITHNSPATGDLSSAGGVSAETLLNFPTTVLFWGNETQVSSLGSCLDLENGHQGVVSAQSVSTSNTSSSNGVERHLVIDIPRQINEEEDQKSPAPTRLGSLKRLLSRDRKINPYSTSNVDAEQAGRSQS